MRVTLIIALFLCNLHAAEADAPVKPPRPPEPDTPGEIALDKAARSKADHDTKQTNDIERFREKARNGEIPAIKTYLQISSLMRKDAQIPDYAFDTVENQVRATISYKAKDMNEAMLFLAFSAIDIGSLLNIQTPISACSVTILDAQNNTASVRIPLTAAKRLASEKEKTGRPTSETVDTFAAACDWQELEKLFPRKVEKEEQAAEGTILGKIQRAAVKWNAPAEELWSFGPKPNIYTPGPVEHSITPDGVRGARDTAGTTQRRDLRIARMTIRQGKGNLNTDLAFDTWRSRLSGIIDEKELHVAKGVLDSVLKKTYKSELNARETADHSIPSSEGSGTRFRTTARIVRGSQIEVEIHWLNPKEPEAIDARKDLPKTIR